MLDLSKLIQPKEVVVPVLNDHFVYNSKQYYVDCENGWHRVKIVGNRVYPLHADIPEPTGFQLVQGYTCNNSIIFQNFDVAKRKWGFDIWMPFHFNQSQTFEAVKAIVWEDDQIYWFEPNYSNVQIFGLKDLFEVEETLDGKKGITPELRTLFLFHSLERDQLREIAKQIKNKEDEEKMMSDLPTRLKITFERAGAELTNYALTGNRIIADWKMPGSNHQYNSVIDANTWMILEAGFCMSNDDRRHNITSMVKTAEDYEDRDLTYITRH